MKLLTIIRPLGLITLLFILAVPTARCGSRGAHPFYQKKGKLYISWGYNRSWYTRSNMHFHGSDYDFRLTNIAATDRPTPFDSRVYLNPGLFTIPQYYYRFQYYLSDHFSMSVGMDHMKYVMITNQPSYISGRIDSTASEKYAGNYERTPITVSPDLLRFEHTDGLNFAEFELEYSRTAWQVWHGKLILVLSGGIGGGVVIPRTDVRIFGDGLNNDFHIAGCGYSGKAGMRLEFFHHLFLQADIKGGYLTLPSVIMKNNAVDLADHNFGFLETYAVLGYTFQVRKSRD